MTVGDLGGQVSRLTSNGNMQRILGVLSTIGLGLLGWLLLTMDQHSTALGSLEATMQATNMSLNHHIDAMDQQIGHVIDVENQLTGEVRALQQAIEDRDATNGMPRRNHSPN